MKSFKVAVVQMNALKDDLDHNVQVHLKFIQNAAKVGCRLVMFPELSLTAHYGDARVVQFAGKADEGALFDTMSEQAREHGIVISYGFCESAHGTHYNSQALVGPAGLIGVQRKIHASGDEYFSFRMGRSFEVFDLGFCKAGTLICYDSSFPEAWRILALKGAEVVLLPHASRSGPGKRIPERKQLTDLREWVKGLPDSNGVYAENNALFAVYGDQVDFNGHSTHSGGAFVLDPLGDVVSKARASLQDLMITARLDSRLLSKARRASGYALKTRRPEVYTELTRMI